MAAWQADHDASRISSLLVSHVLVPPAMEALLSSDNCVVQGFLAAGHVCTIMGYEEYFPIADKHKVPIVVTGFEPLEYSRRHPHDRHSVGRSRHEGQVIQPRGSAGRTDRRRSASRTSSNSPRQWRGLGDILGQRLPVARRFEKYDAAPSPIRSPANRRANLPSASADSFCKASRSLRVPGVRCEVYAGRSARRSHGIVGRRMRGRLPRTWQTPKSAGVRAERGFKSWKVVNDRIVLRTVAADGSRTSSSKRFFSPCFQTPCSKSATGAALHQRLALAFTTDSFVVRPDLSAATSVILRSTARSTISPCASLYLSSGFILEEGLEMETCGWWTTLMTKAVANAGVQLVTGDTKVVDKGKGDGIFINTLGIA